MTDQWFVVLNASRGGRPLSDDGVAFLLNCRDVRADLGDELDSRGSGLGTLRADDETSHGLGPA